jgi:hypothetical protein
METNTAINNTNNTGEEYRPRRNKSGAGRVSQTKF